jgi:hypothetical protein
VSTLAMTPLPEVQDEVCPWCEQPIPHEKFAEIQERIQSKERARLAEIEAGLREEHQRHIAEVTAASEAQLAELKRKSATDLANAAAATKRAIAAARAKAKLEADAEFKPQVKQAQAHQRLAEQRLKALQTEQEDLLATRLKEQRDALDEDKQKAVNKERSKAFREKQKLTDKVTALQRQLENKTADDLGEGAEVDLFEALKHEFPEDTIVRVDKGEPGADIIQTVIANGRECGQIIYDSKNRLAWRNDYVTKLRADQLAAKADVAVLVSRPFPSGTKQLHVQDGVIVVNPARTLALIHIVREHTVSIANLRVSDDGRAEKMSKLYDFITTGRCSQLLDQVDKLADNLLDLDVKETRAHNLTWNKRGELVKGVQHAVGTLVAEIGLIVNVDSDPA